MTNRNPSETTSYNRLGDDLRAAVAAGIVTEAQAAGILVLAQSRAGTRAAHSPEDEPFEFFRGFSEVFLAVGLSILLAGFVALLVWLGLSSGAFLVAPLVVAAPSRAASGSPAPATSIRAARRPRCARVDGPVRCADRRRRRRPCLQKCRFPEPRRCRSRQQARE